MLKLILQILANISSWFQQNQLLDAGKAIRKKEERDANDAEAKVISIALGKLTPTQLDELLKPPGDRGKPNSVSDETSLPEGPK